MGYFDKSGNYYFQDGGSFKDAFRKARNAGLKEFEWKGKVYSTKYKEELEAERNTGSTKDTKDSTKEILREAAELDLMTGAPIITSTAAGTGALAPAGAVLAKAAVPTAIGLVSHAPVAAGNTLGAATGAIAPLLIPGGIGYGIYKYGDAMKDRVAKLIAAWKNR